MTQDLSELFFARRGIGSSLLGLEDLTISVGILTERVLFELIIRVVHVAVVRVSTITLVAVEVVLLSSIEHFASLLLVPLHILVTLTCITVCHLVFSTHVMIGLRHIMAETLTLFEHLCDLLTILVVN